MSQCFYNHEIILYEIKALLTRREGNHGARVTLARGLPQHLHTSFFFFSTRHVYNVDRVTLVLG